MKITHQFARKNLGGALLITIVVIGIAAATIISYLVLLQSEYTTVARSQTWNGAMILAEAGVEDGLGLVNKYAGTSTPLSYWTNTAVSEDNWSVSSVAVGGTNYSVFHMCRTNGSLGCYNVYVTNMFNGTDYTPQILSVGTAFWTMPGVSGNSFVGAAYTAPATRKVYIQTADDSTSSGGLTAQQVINFNGQKSTVDSYDSSDPTKSLWNTNWFYNGHNFGIYTNTLRTADVVVGTDGSLLQADGVNIYGYVNTGPGGTVSIKSGGVVGDLNWIGPNPNSPYNSGIQPGHQRDDMNIQFPPVSAPTPTNTWYNTWLKVAPVSISIGGVSYDYMITNIVGKPGTPTNKIYYAMDSLAKGKSIFINASNVVLYLTNGISMKSGDNLTVNTNSNVEIYTAASIDTGNGLVNNQFFYAPALSIYGLPTCTSVSFGGNAALTMKIYAPGASVTFNGGGSSAYDVAGSMMVANITVNGHYNFHFDEVLKTNSPPTRYLPALWQEK